MNASIVDVLIENITTDQKLLDDMEKCIEEAKNDKKEIVDRLKDYRKDISVLLKYADEKQRKKMEDLGFDVAENEHGLNAVASVALGVLMKEKDHKMTNGGLYDAYVATFKNKNDASTYTEFNIKCRSLFNSQRLIRTKNKDSQNSREDIISVNGSILPDTKESKK